ncbi:MAG TPA: diacylglycerol kinase family protein [Tepidisphaeraceae bacterium]
MIFVNPIAGRGRGQMIAHQLENRLHGDNYVVDTFWELAADIPTERLTAPARTAIVIGGDGTLRAAIERLLAADVLPPLLPIPLGTANMMGKYLGIRFGKDDLPDRVANALRDPQPRLLDAGRANGKLFIQVVGVGFDAQVVYHLDRLRRGPISFWSYMLPSALALLEYEPAPLAVKVDGQEIFAEQCGFAFIGNLAQYGTGFPILVDARPNDGLLDVCAVQCESREKLIHLFLTAATGEHPYIEGSVYRKGKHVEVTSSSSIRVEIDGDPGGVTPVNIDLLPIRLPFIVP